MILRKAGAHSRNDPKHLLNGTQVILPHRANISRAFKPMRALSHFYVERSDTLR